MTKVFKYPLIAKDGIDNLTVTLPEKHNIVHAGFDPNRQVCVWAEVDPDDTKMVTYEVYRVGTGWEIDLAKYWHLFTLLDGMFVWHFYVKKDNR